jgi:FKBP-type peptidyl-prolyl cis-trans isomerase SlyD
MTQTKVAKDRMIAISYRLRDVDGEEIDSTGSDEPLSYVHGHSQILPGLENALQDRMAGDEVSIDVAAEDGYGPHREELVVEVPRAQFGFEPRPGMVVQAQLPDGRAHHLLIVGVSEDSVTLDGNHPLAGRALHFDVTVESVREATEAELDEARQRVESSN